MFLFAVLYPTITRIYCKAGMAGTYCGNNFEVCTKNNHFPMRHLYFTRFVASFLLCCAAVSAAFCQGTFQRNYGRAASNDVARAIIATADGYMLAGSARGVGTDSWDGSLIRINHNGDILWQKTYAYTGGGLDDFNHVAQTSDGGFLAVGAASGFENGPTDLIMVKTDADGNPLWQKRVSGSSSNFNELATAVLPVSGGYIVSGTAVTATGNSSYYRGLLYRLDEDGDVVWSKLYSSGASHISYLEVRYASGDTLFACGQRDNAGVFARISASTGNLIAMQSYDLPDFSDDAFQSMTPAPNGDFLLAGRVPDASGFRQWVCRVTRKGELRWSKLYYGIGQGSITQLSDGHFLLAATPTYLFGNLLDPILVKIDGDGEVVWAENFGKPGTDIFTRAMEAPDGGIIAVGLTRQPDISIHPLTLVVKTDKNGRVAGCCRQPHQVTTVLPSTNVFASVSTLSTFFNPQDFSLITEANLLVPQDFCPPGPPEQVVREVSICPGDSVLIGGVFYSAPGTVTETIPGIPCDTLVTYTIQYTDPGGASAFGIQCPADRVVQLTAGAGSAVVSFDAPSAQSDCSCPGIEMVQTAGLPGGSAFPVGTHDICFRGEDYCGSISECCFKISVVEEEEDEACDVKNNGCLSFELLCVTRDAAWNRSYHIRVTNNCNQELAYVAFQLPDGATAVAPANNTTYTTPGGRHYTVRNPNYSPFHSIRFSSQNAGIQGGTPDVFRYTLPPQSAPDYIRAVVKTGTQTYTEVYLNTFNCPVEPDLDAPRPAEGRNPEGSLSSGNLQLFPNPSNGVLFADLGAVEGQMLQIRIFDALGNLVHAQHGEADGGTIRIDLPAGMASGLYQFEATHAGGGRQVKRFALH